MKNAGTCCAENIHYLFMLVMMIKTFIIKFDNYN
jgi:hypothetical protein